MTAHSSQPVKQQVLRKHVEDRLKEGNARPANGWLTSVDVLSLPHKLASSPGSAGLPNAGSRPGSMTPCLLQELVFLLPQSVDPLLEPGFRLRVVAEVDAAQRRVDGPESGVH